MTNINYYTTDEGFAIKAEGHAGYARAGADIVCAAVSMLLQTLAYRIMDITLRYNFDIKSGYFYLDCDTAEGLEAFRTILTGLEALESEYPKHIRISGGCPIIPKPKME